MQTETAGMTWSDELDRWVPIEKSPVFGSYHAMIPGVTLSVEILAEEMRWNGTALTPGTQVRCLRTDKVFWVESCRVEKSK